MKTLLVLILLIALGAAGYWYLSSSQHQRELRDAQDQVSHRAEQVKDAVQDKLKDFSLSAPDIKQELERSGKVVRRKASEVGGAITDAATDARITAAIKAKLVAEPKLSALRISVNTTAGVVTLSGTVDSTEDISRAMKLALATDGVTEVASTLQVRATK